MNPATIWLIAELLKLGITRLTQAGKYDTLTQAEAEAMVKQIGDGLSVSLPTPEDLENPPQ